MGLGGFLAAQSELEHYKSEKRREEREIVDCPEEEEEECYQVLAEYGVTREVSSSMFCADIGMSTTTRLSERESHTLGEFHDAFRIRSTSPAKRPSLYIGVDDRSILFPRGSHSSHPIFLYTNNNGRINLELCTYWVNINRLRSV